MTFAPYGNSFMSVNHPTPNTGGLRVSHQDPSPGTTMRRQFNMVEIVLALVVIIIGIIGVMSLFPVGMETSQRSVSKTSAAEAADQFLHFFAAKVNENWLVTNAFPDAKPVADDSSVAWSAQSVINDAKLQIQFATVNAAAETFDPAVNSTGLFRLQQISVGNVTDFDGVLRAWKKVEDFGGGAVNSARTVELFVEVSWPAQMGYVSRQKSTHHLVMFKPGVAVTGPGGSGGGAGGGTPPGGSGGGGSGGGRGGGAGGGGAGGGGGGGGGGTPPGGAQNGVLEIRLAAPRMSENGGAIAGTVVRSNAPNTAPVTVSLSSSDTTEAAVPSTVTIAAGASSTPFIVTAVNDAEADGEQTVTLTAAATNYTSGSASLAVTDDEAPVQGRLTVTLGTDTMAENGGTIAASVSRVNIATTAAQVVALTTSDASEATVPASVTIPAGATSVAFMLSAVNDLDVDGTQTVSVTATANGLLPGEAQFSVTDDDAARDAPIPNPIIIEDEQGRGSAVITRTGPSEADVFAASLCVNLTRNGFTYRGNGTVTVSRNAQGIATSLTIAGSGTLYGRGGNSVTVSAEVQLPQGGRSAALTMISGSERDQLADRNIDDSRSAACGDPANDPRPMLTVLTGASGMSENGGSISATVVRANGNDAVALAVTLSSNDTTEATVPASVTIAAGASSAAFTLTGVNDRELDGPQTVTVTAKATDYTDGSAQVVVSDDEVAGPPAQIIVQDERNGHCVLLDVRNNSYCWLTPQGKALSGAITFTFSYDAAGLAIAAWWNTNTRPLVSGTADLRAGSANAQYVSADNTLQYGANDADIYNSVCACTPGMGADPATLALAFSGSSAVAENAGQLTATLKRLNADVSGALTVTLSSSDTGEAGVPATVTIPAGQESVTFTVTGVDDLIPDGDQTVTLTATATGFQAGSASITVTDNEVPRLVIQVPANGMSENGGSIIATVIRVDCVTEVPMTVIMTSSDTSEATVPASVTIAAGQTQTTCTLTAVDDNANDGDQAVTITAASTNVQSGLVNITVTDNESVAPPPADDSDYRPIVLQDDRNGHCLVVDWDPASAVTIAQDGKLRFTYKGSSADLVSGFWMNVPERVEIFPSNKPGDQYSTVEKVYRAGTTFNFFARTYGQPWGLPTYDHYAFIPMGDALYYDNPPNRNLSGANDYLSGNPYCVVTELVAGKKWSLAFEDLPGDSNGDGEADGCDWDYNDIVVEVELVPASDNGDTRPAHAGWYCWSLPNGSKLTGEVTVRVDSDNQSKPIRLDVRSLSSDPHPIQASVDLVKRTGSASLVQGLSTLGAISDKNIDDSVCDCDTGHGGGDTPGGGDDDGTAWMIQDAGLGTCLIIDRASRTFCWKTASGKTYSGPADIEMSRNAKGKLINVRIKSRDAGKNATYNIFNCTINFQSRQGTANINKAGSYSYTQHDPYIDDSTCVCQ